MPPIPKFDVQGPIRVYASGAAAALALATSCARVTRQPVAAPPLPATTQKSAITRDQAVAIAQETVAAKTGQADSHRLTDRDEDRHARHPARNGRGRRSAVRTRAVSKVQVSESSLQAVWRCAPAEASIPAPR